jgi:hypothetical protein
MKRRKAGMERRRSSDRRETPLTARAAFPALHRNPLAARRADAYSALHRKHTTQPDSPKDSAMTTMQTTSLRTKVAGFVLAALTSATILGGTIGAMEASAENVQGDIVTLERLVISAETSQTATN